MALDHYISTIAGLQKAITRIDQMPVDQERLVEIRGICLAVADTAQRIGYELERSASPHEITGLIALSRELDRLHQQLQATLAELAERLQRPVLH